MLHGNFSPPSLISLTCRPFLFSLDLNGGGPSLDRFQRAEWAEVVSAAAGPSSGGLRRRLESELMFLALDDVLDAGRVGEAWGHARFELKLVCRGILILNF